MRIYCDSIAAFVGPEYRGLQRLLMRVRLGQHELVLEDLDGFFTSEFFSTRSRPTTDSKSKNYSAANNRRSQTAVWTQRLVSRDHMRSWCPSQ
jgi:hypothetical protein